MIRHDELTYMSHNYDLSLTAKTLTWESHDADMKVLWRWHEKVMTMKLHQFKTESIFMKELQLNPNAVRESDDFVRFSAYAAEQWSDVLQTISDKDFTTTTPNDITIIYEKGAKDN